MSLSSEELVLLQNMAKSVMARSTEAELERVGFELAAFCGSLDSAGESTKRGRV